ncbi:MAG: GlsB/YeaQ/YmgE family stress response membrane protein [Anaerolineae bacterium]|nr:MAG: GlsB/YeaQ/YmgE family stress response membrane protein [Anaerolineae bacterium]
MGFVVWIIGGIIAGWLTGLIMKGKGFGLIGDLVVGLVGGLLGGWLASLIGLSARGWLGQIVLAVIGGVILVAVVRAIQK